MLNSKKNLSSINHKVTFTKNNLKSEIINFPKEKKDILFSFLSRNDVRVRLLFTWHYVYSSLTFCSLIGFLSRSKWPKNYIINTIYIICSPKIIFWNLFIIIINIFCLGLESKNYRTSHNKNKKSTCGQTSWPSGYQGKDDF